VHTYAIGLSSGDTAASISSKQICMVQHPLAATQVQANTHSRRCTQNRLLKHSTAKSIGCNPSAGCTAHWSALQLHQFELAVGDTDCTVGGAPSVTQESGAKSTKSSQPSLLESGGTGTTAAGSEDAGAATTMHFEVPAYVAGRADTCAVVGVCTAEAAVINGICSGQCNGLESVLFKIKP
jgi:hypothetical protein